SVAWHDDRERVAGQRRPDVPCPIRATDLTGDVAVRPCRAGGDRTRRGIDRAPEGVDALLIETDEPQIERSATHDRHDAVDRGPDRVGDIVGVRKPPKRAGPGA